MSPLSTVRRTILFVTIGSFSVAALMGVAALLAGGSFGETEARILLTTLVVGTTSVLVLCYLATGDTPWQGFGVVGGLTVLAPLAQSLYAIWPGWDGIDGDAFWKALAVGTILAASLAQASLLLALAWDRRSIGWLLNATLVLVAVLAVQSSAMLVLESESGWLLRLLGIVAILDVLGTLVTIAVAKFGGAAALSRGPEPLTLSDDLSALLTERAAVVGRPPASLLDDAVRAYLGASPV